MGQMKTLLPLLYQIPPHYYNKVPSFFFILLILEARADN